jgi:hypothetical protein
MYVLVLSKKIARHAISQLHPPQSEGVKKADQVVSVLFGKVDYIIF